MAETAELIKLLQQQMQQQAQQIQLQEQRYEEEKQRAREEKDLLLKQLDKMVQAAAEVRASSSTTSIAAPPSFTPFDSTRELWDDYHRRFRTFVTANAVSSEREAQIFLTNQSTTVYKLLTNLASQQTPPKDVNQLSMDEIVAFMKDQFDPKRFIVRERYKFWSDMKRKPGETIQELAARIRQDAATCDFPSIKDPQDEALRTRFICSVNNEAVLKAFFKVKDDDLSFTKAIQIAIETEDAAKVAKETVHGSLPRAVSKVNQKGGNPKKQATQGTTPSKASRRRIPVTGVVIRNTMPMSAVSRMLPATTARRRAIWRKCARAKRPSPTKDQSRRSTD
jgi:hypothetical protein